MRHALFCSLALAISVAASVAAQPAIQKVVPMDVSMKWPMLKQLAPSARMKIDTAARAIAPSLVNGAFSEAAVSAEAQRQFPQVPSTDLDTVVMLVLLQASKDAGADLKQLLDEIRKVNAEKESSRQLLEGTKAELRRAGRRTADSSLPAATTTGSGVRGGAPAATGSLVQRRTPFLQLPYLQLTPRAAMGPLTGKSAMELQTLEDSLEKDLRTFSEMGEAESLRLQMAMDRLSKMMTTLSNLLKKTSETSSGITQNLK